jgi:predicted MPP superfamily phosphohydrolase
VLRLIIFLSVVITILVLGHVYIARRFSAGANEPMARITKRVIYGQGLLILCSMSARGVGSLGVGWQVPLQWAGMLALGFFSLELVSLIAIDVGDWLWRKARSLRGLENETDADRRALLLRPFKLGAMALTTAIGATGVRQAYMAAEVVEVEIPIANLPPALDGFRIAQVSDIHVGPTIRGSFLARIVHRVNELEADMVAVTGDLVDGSVASIGHDVEPIAGFKSRHGTYFITGNHEYYAGAERWIEFLRPQGVTVLLNEHVVLQHDESQLLLAGVTDYRAGRQVEGHATDPEGAAAGAPPCPARVLLAHQPRSAYAAAKTGAYDLQLSGHTHGGQYVPFSWFIQLFQPFAVGLHRHEGMWVYTNRGTGYWGPPIRTGVRPEITSLVLRRETT